MGYSLRDYNLRLLFRTLRWRLDPASVPVPSFAVDHQPDPLILEVFQNNQNFVTFILQDLWTFVPRIYQEIKRRAEA